MANNKFNYLNEKCLVCNKTFTEGDDIVVCPDCGTPHHRECYKENTKCANHEMHSENFRWEATFVTPEEIIETPENNEEKSLDQQIDLNQMPFGMPMVSIQPNFLDSFPKEVEDGVKTEDVAVFVRQEFPRYLRKFQQVKDGKHSWNWAAFFFAPYWFFFRKLHKLGVIFLAIQLLLTSMSFLPPAVALSETLYEFETQISELSKNAETDEELQESVMAVYESTYKELYENKAGLAISATQSITNLVISIFIGLNANKWYYKHTISQVKSISSEPNDEEKRRKLFSLGGTSYSAAFLALLAEKAVFLILEMVLPTLMK